MNSVNDYMTFDYTLNVTSKRDVDNSLYFVAHFEELEGLEGSGGTQGEAIEDLNTAKEIWFEKMLENGFEIPLPKSNL